MIMSMSAEEISQKYSFIKPFVNYYAIKVISEDENKGGLLKVSGLVERRCYGRIIAVEGDSARMGTLLKVGDVVIFEEFEGQELPKWRKVEEDGILIIRREAILARVDL